MFQMGRRSVRATSFHKVISRSFFWPQKCEIGLKRQPFSGKSESIFNRLVLFVALSEEKG